MKRSTGTILLVEDNADDALLISLALKRARVANPLAILTSGAEALQFLRGEGEYADRARFPLPSLVLLDLEMPAMDGFEVLAWLRGEPDLRHLPVVVITSSTYSPTVTRAYQAGANSFVTKPNDLAEFTAAMKEVADFWLGRCQLPDRQATRKRINRRESVKPAKKHNSPVFKPHPPTGR